MVVMVKYILMVLFMPVYAGYISHEYSGHWLPIVLGVVVNAGWLLLLMVAVAYALGGA